MKVIHHLELKLNIAMSVTFVVYAWLLCSFILYQFVALASPLWTILAIQCLPLLVFLPGMLRKKPNAFIWLCFVILLYFIRSVLGVSKASPDWMDISLLGCTVILFISAMMTSRWLKYQAANVVEKNR